MMSRQHHCLAVFFVVVLTIAVGPVSVGRAEDAAMFFSARKQLSMLVSSEAGGGYDVFARLLVRYMPKNMPGNPTFIVQNMPGASGMRAANYVYNVAPRDGSVVALISRQVPTAPLLFGTSSNAQFDAVKFGWVCNGANSAAVMGMVGTSSKVQTIEAAKSTEAVLGASSPIDEGATFALLVNETLGTKFRLVLGYKGMSDVMLATDRGELDGQFISGWGGIQSKSVLEEHRQGKIGFILQVAKQKDPDVGDVPLIMDLVTKPDDRAMVEFMLSRLELGRPLMTPPAVPDDRLGIIRAACLKSLTDPQFVHEAASAGQQVDAMSGADTQARIEALYRTPEPLLNRVRKIIGSR